MGRKVDKKSSKVCKIFFSRVMSRNPETAKSQGARRYAELLFSLCALRGSAVKNLNLNLNSLHPIFTSLHSFFAGNKCN